jgi:hypothetical protein
MNKSFGAAVNVCSDQGARKNPQSSERKLQRFLLEHAKAYTKKMDSGLVGLLIPQQ